MNSICSKKNCIYAYIGSDKKTEIYGIDNEFIEDRKCVCNAYSSIIAIEGNAENYEREEGKYNR